MNIVDADIKKDSGNLVLDVTVAAPTLGWTNVALSAVQYVTPPVDGLQDVILSGDPL